MNQIPSRVQPGVPTGGQFATSAKAEPTISLAVEATTPLEFEREVLIETKRRAANRAWESPANESAYWYGREHVAARALAIASDPTLLDNQDELEKVTGQMLRRSSRELTEQAPDLFTRQMTAQERERTVRHFAEYAVVNDRVTRSGGSYAPKATRGSRDAAITALSQAAAPQATNESAAIEEQIEREVDFAAADAADQIMAVVHAWSARG